MNHRLRRMAVAALSLMFAASVFAQTPPQTFSANLIITNASGRPDGKSGRLYVSHDKVRIELSDFAGNFFVVDGTRPAAWYVRPRQFIFMDARQSTPLTQVFVRVDSGHACAEWRTMERIARSNGDADDWSCKQLGQEIVDGRAAVKYRVVTRHGISDRWVDPQLGFPIKWQSGHDAVVLSRTIDAPADAALFVIPPTYQKFDPLTLIERLKLSDVWVEHPKL